MVSPRSSSGTRGRTAAAHRCATVLRGVAISAVLLLLLASPGPAQEEAPRDAQYTGGGETFLYSRYVSRGIASSEGPVLQPSAWVALNDFTLSAFGNYVLNREKQQGRFNEVDASLAWSREWSQFTIEPKFTLYTYPNTTDQTQYELGFTVARDLGAWKLSAFNSMTVASSEGASYYGELSFGYHRDLFEKWSLAAEFTVAWPTPAATLEGKLSYELTHHWSVTIHAGYSITRADAATDDNHASSNQDSLSQGRNGFIGLGLGFRF